MLGFKSKQHKKLLTICTEYKRIFDLQVPQGIPHTEVLQEIKINNLERLAFEFDKLGGWEFVKERGNTLMDGIEGDHLFIPRLSRYRPEGSSDVEFHGEYTGVKLMGLKHRFRYLRWLRLKRQEYYINLPDFDRYVELYKPNPDILQRHIV